MPIFKIRRENGKLVFRCLKDITIRFSPKEIEDENTENDLINLTGCVESAFKKIREHRDMNLANGIFREIYINDKDAICERLAEVFLVDIK